MSEHEISAIAEQLREHARLLAGMASLIEQRGEIAKHQVRTADAIAHELTAAIRGAL